MRFQFTIIWIYLCIGAVCGTKNVDSSHNTLLELQTKVLELEKLLQQCQQQCGSKVTKDNAKREHKEEVLRETANMIGLETSILSIGRPHSSKKKRDKDKEHAVEDTSSEVPSEARPPLNTTTDATSLNDSSVSAPLPPVISVPLPVSSQSRAQEIAGELLKRPPSPFAQHKFYMYELEEEFWWRWPAPGTDCSANGYVGHEHATLSGMGTSIIPEDGLYLTWHFSLFSSLFNRLKRSSRRTYDPSQASLFVIPYDLGLDGYLNSRTCANSRRCTPGLAQRLQDQLNKSTYWHRHGGADHAVLWSLGQYHPWPHNGCDVFMRDFCSKCTFTCYWMDSTKPESRFVSVPFPSAYHWSDSVKNVPWDIAQAPNRTLTAVYLGSTQTLNPAHTKIRRAMTAQCNVSTECHWMQIAHSSKDSSIADFLSVYKRSVFCLCPPGDDPARKAVFDAIISGCIPVIFQKETLYNQYPWHIGEEDALDISVSIPGALVRAGKLDFMSVLLNIPKETIYLKQQALMRVAPRVQYAIPPESMLEDRYDSSQWEPAFPDGVDVTLDGMFERVGHLLRNETTNIPPPRMLQKAWHQQYDVVIVKVPGEGQPQTPSAAVEDARGRSHVRGQRQNGHHVGHKQAGHGH